MLQHGKLRFYVDETNTLPAVEFFTMLKMKNKIHQFLRVSKVPMLM